MVNQSYFKIFKSLKDMKKARTIPTLNAYFKKTRFGFHEVQASAHSVILKDYFQNLVKLNFKGQQSI